ncbi:hypothetical protein ATO11_20905 [Pseudaestuariivita atlantica]|uniref:DNA sulfur modification protein DndD n=2 Tax=Pseudaestuariivita atlantica TaxID=1317121 RepID=A0A0L1JJ34_9RHOB|nr:hypothetical protein ATO11_20905 [Pseudaestuariivita atlantica]
MLSFVRVENGQETDYSLTRAWSSRGKSVVETFDLIRDGHPISDLERSEYAQYVEELIPPGLSQLFFFDGEKIQEIADDDGSLGLRDAIRALLGLDIIDQLQTDLTVYTSRRADQDSRNVFDRLLEEQERLKSELETQQDHRAELQSSCDQAARRVERFEAAYRSEGGRQAQSREDVLAKLRSAEDTREELSAHLKRAANDLLPLSLAPSLVDRLYQSANDAREGPQRDAVHGFINAFEENALGRASKKGCWSREHFDELRASVAKGPAESANRLWAEPDWILQRLNELSDGRRQTAANLADRFDRNRELRASLKRELEGFDTGQAEQALADLKEAERTLGGLERELQICDERIDRQLRELEVIGRKFRSEEIALKRQAQEERGSALAVRAQGALSEFGTALLKDRIARLKSEFVECFNKLSRKKSLVASIDVDPADFSVTLIGSDGVTIAKNSLSAGERQIYAISMLWALGKTSGRQLPIVIDTPFSRLDQSHRISIVRDYLPTASHQVILLCTDTEMTPKLADTLEAHIARSYKLEATAEARQTTLFPIEDLAEELA